MKKNYLLLVFLFFAVLLVIFILVIAIKRGGQNNQLSQKTSTQDIQEEIIQKAENHNTNSKSANINPSDNIVTITTYSRELFNRTEYALGIKYSDFKNLDVNTGELKNESTEISSDIKNFINKVITDASNGNVSGLVKLTDPAIIKIIGEDALVKQYSQYYKYFQDYKSQDISSGFAATLTDDSFVLLASFINDMGTGRMYGIVISQTSSGYFISQIFPGETSILVAFPPNKNKSPIIIANPIDGFNRKDLTEIGGNTLIPKNWYFRHEYKNGTEIYFVSKEQIIGYDSMFETGLTLNVIQQKNIPNGDAQKYMDEYISYYIQKYPQMLQRTGQANDFVYREIEGVMSDGESSWKEVLRVSANTKTNTLYIVIFESTPEKWDSIWYPIGKPMLEYLSLSSTY